jgi:hypothetical protein
MGFEIRSSGFDKVTKNFWPVIPQIPGDLARWVNFHRHHLADASTLHQDDQGPDAAAPATPLLSPIDVCGNEWIVAGHK